MGVASSQTEARPTRLKARLCEQCERLPLAPAGGGTLYLLPPLASTRLRLEGVLKQCGVSPVETHPGILGVPIVPGLLERFAVALRTMLSPLELRDTRSLLTPGGAEPGIPEFMRSQSLSKLLALAGGEWLLELLRERRMEMHFQPIVHCDDPRRLFGHECLLRARSREGTLIPPADLFRTATEADILYHLDRAARLLAVREARRHDLSGLIFINFCPSAIYNAANCLRTTVQAVEAAGIPPEQVVFEVVESERVPDVAHLVSILQTYRDAGFRIALDDLGAGFSSLDLLGRLRPDFIKLDRALLQAVESDRFKATIAQKLLEAARALDIATVVEGIEHPGQWEWARDHGATYAQGFLFALPASPPPVPRAVGTPAM